MLDYTRTILLGQFEAALSMFDDCLRTCPAEHWESKVARYTFWHVAYHTLCYADLYLTPREEDFQLREIHPAGWAEFSEEYPSRRFEQAELIDYVAVVRAKAQDEFARETLESLQGPCGHARRKFSRGELHIYNTRHIQHHTGQLSSMLRGLGESFQEMDVLRWQGSGWRVSN